MEGTTKFIVYVAMTMLTLVSMWTTYASLHDSILPEPSVPIQITETMVWDCSVPALLLSVAIGLMLLGLKMAIINEERRLSVLGIVGLTVVAFISISFNLDVLYRTADRDFFVRYTTDKMLHEYEEFLTEAQAKLTAKRDELRTELATQQAELASEIEGLRQAPAGVGPRARAEQYRLNLLEGETEVALQSLDEALEIKEEADQLLAQSYPQSIAEAEELQNKLRVLLTDLGAAAGIPLPQPTKPESPIFAVFAKFANWQTIGFMEVFLLAIAFFLDLGDIIGYSMIPKAKQPSGSDAVLYPSALRRPNVAEYVPPRAQLDQERMPHRQQLPVEEGDFFGESSLAKLREIEDAGDPPPPAQRRRSFRIRRP